MAASLVVICHAKRPGLSDVELGLGLGHATHRGLLIAVIAMGLGTLMQATITLWRGGNLQTPIAFGPVLSVGF
jgi:leader peptidase (prepilin peptidase)/N-methyltransferase